MLADGWLHGRGSSDSKAGAAIFAHVLARLKSAAGRWAGSVALLLDVDEHTGAFGGARAFFEDPAAPRVDGVMIGYPGPDHVVTGGRGVLRTRCRGGRRLARHAADLRGGHHVLAAIRAAGCLATAGGPAVRGA